MIGRKYVICDIEATGLDADCDLIEIALITWQDGKILEVFETLINPLRNIPEYISNLTSITNRDLAEAPKFYEVAEGIKMRLEGAVFVSHNTEFDLGLLRKRYGEMGQELRVKNFCTLKVAQHEIPGLRNYNLDALCSFFGIKIEDRHRAIGDARATLELFHELFRLRLKVSQKPLYLPHHEKLLKDLPARPGLLSFKDAKGTVIHLEAAQNMETRARELLVINPENRARIPEIESVYGEATGTALIAEFRRLRFVKSDHKWIILEGERNGEKFFRIRPYRQGTKGLWYFRHHSDAKEKLRQLKSALRSESFAYREGGKSKEEVLKHNQRLLGLSREARFPAENLVLIGDGRCLGERSVVLVRNNHVLGYGYTNVPEEEIFINPERFITQRYFRHLGADLAARNYIRVLKNLRTKTEGWRTLKSAS